MPSELELYKPIAEAISLLLFPHAEVVIHEFKTKCVGAIFNNLSKRKVGDVSLLDEMEKLSDFQEVFPPYFKINWDGRKMKSVSAVLSNRAGKPIGLLCINLDIFRLKGTFFLQLEQKILCFPSIERLQAQATIFEICSYVGVDPLSPIVFEEKIGLLHLRFDQAEN